MQVKITLITPVLNQVNYITETVNSVLDQNYENLEYIVVDGNSTDGTLEILKNYEHQNKINLFIKEELNQAEAINFGIEKSAGEVIGWLNSDDLLNKGALQIISETFENSKTLCMTGDCSIISNEFLLIQKVIFAFKKVLRKMSLKLFINFANIMIQPSTFFSKTLINDLGPLNKNLKYCMDYDLWLRILKKYNVTVIDAKISSFRIHRDSLSSKNFRSQFDEDLKVCLKYNNKFIYFIHKANNFFIKFIYRFIK